MASSHSRGKGSAVLAAALVALAATACFPAPPPPPPSPAFVSANPADHTPWVLDGQVWTIAKVGSRVVVGGQFTQARDAAGGPVRTVTNLFSLDPATGRIDRAFSPSLDGRVHAVVAAPDGRSVFVAGGFKRVNGILTGGLAKLDIGTGRPVGGFAAVANGWVFDAVVRGSKVYLGGSFSEVNDAPRAGLAAVDLGSGAVDPNLTVGVAQGITGTIDGHPVGNPMPYVYRLDVTADASKLVALGNFRRLGGQERVQLGVVDLSRRPAAVSGWQTELTKPALQEFFLRDLAIAPDGRSFVNTAWWAEGNPIMDAATKWDLTANGPGQQPLWVNATGGDSLFSVAVTDRTVYVGGHPRWLNNGNTPELNTPGPAAVERPQVAALDVENGVPYTWAPGQQRGFGATSMVATSEGLWIGSDTEWIAGEYHPRLSFFPLEGGTFDEPDRPVTTPTTLYTADPDGTLRSRSFDGRSLGPRTTVPGGPDWGQVRGAFMVNGTLYTAHADGTLVARPFDGETYGPARRAPSWVSFGGVSGLTYHQGRIYYTEPGRPELFYRYFNPQSGIVGYARFTASGYGDGLDWSRTSGLAVVEGKLFAGRGDGGLYRTDLRDGRPVPGTTVTVERAHPTSPSWRAGGLFALGR